jgi:hypothetical protein
VAALSKACVCGPSLAGIAGSNPTGGLDVCVLWMLCVLSGRGLCVGLITCLGESYRVWCVWVWSSSLDNKEGPWPLAAQLVLIITDILSTEYHGPPVDTKFRQCFAVPRVWRHVDCFVIFYNKTSYYSLFLLYLFHLFQNVQTDVWAQPASYSMYERGASFSVVRQPKL